MADENAHAQVEAFLDILQSKYGMSEQELDGVIRQLVALSKRANKFKAYGDYFARATITVLVTSFFVGVGWAVVHFVKDIVAIASK